jgi:hypothetical protein
MTTMGNGDLRALQGAMAGAVLEPGNAGFDEARSLPQPVGKTLPTNVT